MANDNAITSRKYFLFKFFEYTKRNYRLIQNKRNDSILLILRECLSIYHEIYESKSQYVKDRLKTSLERMLNIIKFYCQYNPIILKSSLNSDFSYLVSLIKAKGNGNGNDENIYYSIMALLKKIEDLDLVKLYVEILKSSNLKFAEVDRLLDSFINELINKGYSLRYLNEWYRANISTHVDIIAMDKGDKLATDNILDTFNQLSNSEKDYIIVFYVNLPEQYINKIKHQNSLNVGNGYIFNICTSEEVEIFKDNQLIEKMPKDYLSPKSVLLKIERRSIDKYNIIQDTYKVLSKYLNLYAMIKGYKNVVGDYCIIAENNTQWQNLNISELAQNRLIKDLDIKEKKFIEDFILLKDELINKKNTYGNILILESALDVLVNSSRYSSENILLNMWTVLELLVYEYNAGSIIEKVRTVIPKAICLYAIKEKINILWDRLQKKKKYKVFENPLIKDFILTCQSNTTDFKYDVKKITHILVDKKCVEDLYKVFNFNINIQRDIADICCLLNNNKSGSSEPITKRYIQQLHESVILDLDRIYRIRNKLVHSSNEVSENLETVVERLFRYVNSILLVFIYQIKSNPEFTIAEILYSTVNTYNWYIEFLNQETPEAEKIVSPRKLFL